MAARRLAGFTFFSVACGCQALAPSFLFPTANSRHRTAASRPSAASSRYPVTTTPENVPNLAVLPTSPRAGKTKTAAAEDRLWDCSSLHKTAKSVACGGAAAGLLALSLMVAHPVRALADSMPGMASGCSSTTNVSGYTIVTCDRQGLDRDGRLLGCSSSENCVSTSAVRVPGKLGSPWEYARQTGDADRAFASLVRAVEGASGATIKTIDTKAHYLSAQFPSKVPPGGVDIVEFLVKPEDQIVLYRSVSRDTLYVYPLQQPVSDQGKIKERLEGIRMELGWDMYTYRGE